jgi:hypothetical protein
MADKVQRYGTNVDLSGCPHEHGGYVTYSAFADLEAERAKLWTKNRELLGSNDVKSAVLGTIKDELRDLKALHADIIEQGRLVQIGASGESKYGAMSAGEYIEWVMGELGK